MDNEETKLETGMAMDSEERALLLRYAKGHIENGEIGKAKKILLELLNQELSEKELSSVMENANAIKALETIEACFERYPKSMQRLLDASNQELEQRDAQAQTDLEKMLGKYA
jgi:hypothetical protein